jgi:hypothetical protein
LARLVNRKYSSRLECVYYIFKSAYYKFGTDTEFRMQELKYDDEDIHNTHKYCQLLEEGFVKHCPYLDNQFDPSKCYATQSVESDSTKDKAVSDIIRSLEGMGFVKSTENKKFLITEEGEKWVNSKFGSFEWQEIIDQAVLSYGPFVGFLFKIKQQDKDIVTISDIYIGYPNTEETIQVEVDGVLKNIELSEGSQKDSVTRTRSKLVSLGITSGLIIPPNLQENSDKVPPHVEYREFINQKQLRIRRIKKTKKFKDVTSKKLYVKHPLSYDHLIKDVRALRENGIEVVRKATLQSESVIKNRRFIIIDLLNRASKENKSISFKKLYTCLEEHMQNFFVEKDKTKLIHILQSELDIAFVAGLPFELVRENTDLRIKPLTEVNEMELYKGAPDSLIHLANSLWGKVNT